jgi:uncharacterized damage-inducible protein DinB
MTAITIERPILAHWADVRAGTLELLAGFRPEELSTTPLPGAWPIGKLFLHIAETEDFWLHAVVRGELETTLDYRLDEHPTPAAIRAVLAAARERTEMAFGPLRPDDVRRQVETPWGETVGLDWVLWHVLEHEIHHRGELSFCLGLLGREGLDV